MKLPFLRSAERQSAPSIGTYNKNWTDVNYWFEKNLILPGFPDSVLTEIGAESFLFKNDGKNCQVPITNNVPDFTQQGIDDSIFNKMQSNELSFWEKGGVARRIKKWENYSKYDYHFKNNFVHILKNAGYGESDPFKAFQSVLDVGCGPFGFGKLFSATDFRVGVDALSASYAELLPVTPDFPKVASFGEGLPFRENTFDLVVSTNAIDHFKSWSESLAEIYRVTKTKGFVFIDVDCKSENELDETHQISIEPDEIIEKIKSLNFKLLYLQIGPRRVCERRVIFIGQKIF